MKLSTRARYALRSMMVIAREAREGKPVKLGDVARRTGISQRYLEQILISLKNAKLLRAIPGKKGGHLLNRPADEISLREIVEAAIGEISIVECVSDPENCMKIDFCECRHLYCILNDRINETLDEFTLSDLEQGRVQALK